MSEVRCAVRVRGLRKEFGSGQSQVQALRSVDLDVRVGEFVAVMGPSGSGKSTLLHLVGGLDKPSGGSVQIDSTDLSTLDDNRLTLLRRKQVGFVFQSFNLLDVLTAEENVALPLVIDGVADAEAVKRAQAALQQVDMQDRAAHLPGELSGGQQQRLAIARGLVTEPLVLLADEPTGNLDSATSDQIMRLLRRLTNEQQQTILMVTHNARHAAIADCMVEMRDGQIVDQHAAGKIPAWSEVVEDLEAN